MAVAKMKKVTILGHASSKAEVTDRLQRRSLVHVISARTDGEGKAPTRLAGQIHELEMAVHKCNFLLGFLEQFGGEKKSFIRSMMASRVYLTRADYDTIEGRIPFEQIYEDAEQLDDELASIRGERSRLKARAAALEPWVDLDMALAERAGTGRTRLLLGSMAQAELELMRAQLADEVTASDLEVVSETGQHAYCAVLVAAEDLDDAQAILTRHGFKALGDEDAKGLPTEEIARIGEALIRLEAKERDVHARIGKLSGLVDDALVLREHLQARYDRAAAEDAFYHTEQSFLLEGWTKAAEATTIAPALEGVTPAVEIALTDPEPGETPPVELDNAKVIRPFEVLTRLYGLPSHDEIDPTPFMAPFFFIFFGMALSDFGYGLALALGCWWAIRHYGLRDNTREFMHLMIYGGIASMLVGVLTGGYFGIDVKELPAALRSLMILDPLSQPLEFMLIAIFLGVVHVVLGVVLEGVDALRHRDVAAAVFDHLTTLVFLVTGLVAFDEWIVQAATGKLSPLMAAIYPIALQAFALSAAALVLLQGRVHDGFAEAARALARPDEAAAGRGWLSRVVDGSVALATLIALYAWVPTFIVATDVSIRVGELTLVLVAVGLMVSPITRATVVRLLAGVFKLYGMSGFVGDFLSYARLMALGLATVLIGLVINMLAKMVFAAPYVGFIFAILLLLGGHAFNLTINLLGAFVHPTRLQFVEFFGQFYEDGGEQFAPLAVRTKHLVFVLERGT